MPDARSMKELAMTTVLPQEPLVPAASPGDVLYEIVNGKYVELPPKSAISARIASVLNAQLEAYAASHALGRAINEALFGLAPHRRRRPDVAFVTYQRWPRNRPLPHTDPWPVAPNLAVEVVSPTDQAEPLLRKLVEYFEADVQLVWVIYPMLRLVYVYESLTHVHGLTGTEELDGGTVLPGFKLALSVLFADAPEDTEPGNGATA
jgi:Uma2 family endonuclease